jgi:hypothetical protein
MSEEDGQKMLELLQQEADRWREKLARPEVQRQVKAGLLVVSPLVEKLMSAFPPRPKK